MVMRGRAGQINHITFPLSPCGSAHTNRQVDLKCHSKILGSVFLLPLKCPVLPMGEVNWETGDLAQSCWVMELFSAEMERARGSSGAFPRVHATGIHPCVLFSHFKSCLAEKIPKKNSAHPRPSQSGTSGRNNGLSFPSKKYIFC